MEGSRCDPNPNEEFAKPDGESLFGNNGKLTPSITILGKNHAGFYVEKKLFSIQDIPLIVLECGQLSNAMKLASIISSLPNQNPVSV